MITLSNFSVSFQNNLALKNASVEIKSGERLGIVGESGSGKTMLALSLMGMIPEGAAISGSIKVEDAVMALIIKSANDVATVVAENISGTEKEFAKLMTCLLYTSDAADE